MGMGVFSGSVSAEVARLHCHELMIPCISTRGWTLFSEREFIVFLLQASTSGC